MCVVCDMMLATLADVIIFSVIFVTVRDITQCVTSHSDAAHNFAENVRRIN